jgi:hypothetical protein
MTRPKDLAPTIYNEGHRWAILARSLTMLNNFARAKVKVSKDKMEGIL